MFSVRFFPAVRKILASALLVAAACAPSADAPASSVVVDDLGDTLRLDGVPRRVVALNPVTTELVFALGAGDRLVGRTSWDLFPEAAKNVTDLGPGIGPNVEAVLGQRPDLVLLYATESNRLAAQQLRAAGVQTLAHRTDKIEDLTRIAPIIAAALGIPDAGKTVVDTVMAALDSVRALPRAERPLRTYWFIWEPPIMTIGSGSYLSDLVGIAGAENVFADIPAPSPQVTLEEIARRDPDVILIGPSNAERIRKSAPWQTVRAVREGRLVVIDTNIVGRPGVRMGEAARFLRRKLVDEAPAIPTAPRR